MQKGEIPPNPSEAPALRPSKSLVEEGKKSLSIDHCSQFIFSFLVSSIISGHPRRLSFYRTLPLFFSSSTKKKGKSLSGFVVVFFPCAVSPIISGHPRRIISGLLHHLWYFLLRRKKEGKACLVLWLSSSPARSPPSSPAILAVVQSPPNGCCRPSSPTAAPGMDPPHNSHPHLNLQARGLIRRPSLLRPPRSNHPHLSFMAYGRQGRPSPSMSQHSRSSHSHVWLVTWPKLYRFSLSLCTIDVCD
ncbi:hypothetical protein MRB53_033036 [Persea americana]|uniref:Uncharacterized protein n=1 Tax=Persea americana TaxID=3435 RepID=A0ACC2KTD0_PERAE|nr:hypothetical protein MRB53_033036 [Persea americana]